MIPNKVFVENIYVGMENDARTKKSQYSVN